ncbi:hypothetical protein ACFLU6_09420 [Acidobacteriota bacterium]
MESLNTSRIMLLFVAGMMLFFMLPARAQVFLPDDPIWEDPDRLDMPAPAETVLSDYYDFVENTFGDPADRTVRRAMNTNTLDEVPNSSWYTNRQYFYDMSIEDLIKGPNRGTGPDMSAPWRIVSGKSQGITPGFQVIDAKGDRYLIKFDPKSNPEMATGAEVICTKFFYALGYNVPENHLVRFKRDQLVTDPKATLKNRVGKKIPLDDKQVEKWLELAPVDEEGTYRAVASKFLNGKPLGPFRYYGTRPDDGNDIIPHEHRRELRALRVLAAWLNHDDSRAINSLDMLVKERGRQFVRHHLIDFGSTLGSGSVVAQKRRPGNEYKFEIKPTLASMASFGIWLRPWVNVAYPDYPSIGRIECDFFDPVQWKPEYPNPAFKRCDRADSFWAANLVMSFTDDEIRAIVSQAEFTDPAAEEYLANVLIKRRDRIGRAYLFLGGGLGRFRISSHYLVFVDLLAEYGFDSLAADRHVTWQEFDNQTGEPGKILRERGESYFKVLIPFSKAEYILARIETPERGTTTVFLQKAGKRRSVAGIRRE